MCAVLGGAEGDVAHVVEAVLALPVFAVEGEDFAEPGAVGSKGRESVGGLDALLVGAHDGAAADDSERLSAA